MLSTHVASLPCMWRFAFNAQRPVSVVLRNVFGGQWSIALVERWIALGRCHERVGGGGGALGLHSRAKIRRSASFEARRRIAEPKRRTSRLQRTTT
jgi:hypothetical protein